MAVELKRADSVDMREPIVEFFWRLRTWPYSTKEEYYRLWDWRCAALSESQPISWIAVEGGAIVGHISLCFRSLSLEGHRIRAGVLTSFRIDEAHREGALAAALLAAPRAAARRGELDLLTGYGNVSAHRVAIALGCVDLGPMQIFARVHRWGPAVLRRSGALRPVAALLSSAARAYQGLRAARPPEARLSLTVRQLSADELRSIDVSHWRSHSLHWNGSFDYLANRFCASEFGTGRVLAVVDSTGGQIEALVAVDGSTRLTILQCEANEAVLSVVEAVEAVVRANPQTEHVRVPLLPGTDLAGEFVSAGYARLPALFADPVIRNTHWSAWWRPQHPLAAELSRTRRWNVWFGWTHH